MERSAIEGCFESVLARLLHSARERYGARLVSLAVYGSVGRGEAGPGSDVDVLVVAEPLPRGRIARVREFEAVERDIEAEIEACRSRGVDTRLSPVFRSPREVEAGSALFLDMTEDARILHDEGAFLASYLRDLAGRLERLGSRRVRVGTSWYWLLKPDLEPGETFEI
jgi:predicted nucleotidyltransferase